MPYAIHLGDCRDVLPTLPANSVHCVVTSPPYYGLRDYGVVGQLGLEATPDEYLAAMVAVFRAVRRVMRDDAVAFINMGDGYCDKQLLLIPARLALALQADGWWLRSDIIWAKCNPMPESVTDRPTSSHEHVFLLSKAARYYYDSAAIAETSVADHPSGNGYKRDARLSYRDDGGARGNDMQWNCIGGSRNARNVWSIATEPLSSVFSCGNYRIASRDCSVHDRQADLTRVLECDAQQAVFQFARSPGTRSRPAELPEGAVVSISVDRSLLPSDVSSAIGHNNGSHRMPALSERDVIFGDISGGHTACRGFLDHSFAMYARIPASSTSPGASPDGERSCQPAQNRGRIVGIATFQPRPDGCTCYYAGTVHRRQDHFASFPTALAERCIRAGTSERGCCAQCGKPWVRITQRIVEFTSGSGRAGNVPNGKHAGAVQALSGDYDIRMGPSVSGVTTGWSAGCACNAAVVPATVLDPFAGAGTTLLVADRLQRNAMGIELSADYVRMARERLEGDAPLFTMQTASAAEAPSAQCPSNPPVWQPQSALSPNPSPQLELFAAD